MYSVFSLLLKTNVTFGDQKGHDRQCLFCDPFFYWFYFNQDFLIILTQKLLKYVLEYFFYNSLYLSTCYKIRIRILYFKTIEGDFLNKADPENRLLCQFEN